jgi:hypothetical protein
MTESRLPAPDEPSNAPAWASAGVVLLLLALALRVLANVRAVDIDLFHEMALFREILHLGYVPRTDSFAYTPTNDPTVHHEWATGGVFYLVTVAMGLGTHGLMLLRLGLLAGITAFCISVARKRGAGLVELSVLAPLAVVFYWTGVSPVRAQLFTFFFLAVLLWMLELDRGGSRRWIPFWFVLLVAWVNLHGGVLVGIGLLGIYTAERVLRATRRDGPVQALRDSWHLVAVTLASFPMLLVNPYGWDYVPFLVDAILLERPYMVEWYSLWEPLNRVQVLPLFLASVGVAAYGYWRGGRQAREVAGGLMLLVAAIVAFRSIRMLPVYATVWIAYVPPLLVGSPLSDIFRRAWSRWNRPIGGAALVAGLLATVMVLPHRPFEVVLPANPDEAGTIYPAGAVTYLDEVDFEGNLMTPFPVGAYVSWMLHPRVLVGMDSRYEVAYASELAEETQRIYAGIGDWAEFLSRFPTDAVLVPAGEVLDREIVEAAEADGPDARWREVYRDDAFAIHATGTWADRLPVTNRSGQRIEGRFP